MQLNGQRWADQIRHVVDMFAAWLTDSISSMQRITNQVCCDCMLLAHYQQNLTKRVIHEEIFTSGNPDGMFPLADSVCPTPKRCQQEDLPGARCRAGCSGLNIIFSSGVSSAGAKITIRTHSSINGSNQSLFAFKSISFNVMQSLLRALRQTPKSVKRKPSLRTICRVRKTITVTMLLTDGK